MTLRIDRSQCSSSTASKLDDDCFNASTRRTNNAAVGACINENYRSSHGKATHGVRCYRCYLVHSFGAPATRETDAYRDFIPVPLDREHHVSSAAPAA